MDERINQAMLERLENGNLPCNQAFAIARILAEDPLSVGLAANAADIRISRCQLGLFGYGPKGRWHHLHRHLACCRRAGFHPP
jgi:hypothetical protein